MASQDSNPPPWDDSMSDGCSGVMDWLPFVGDMRDCCIEHDRRYHFGGTEADKRIADLKFRRCIQAKRRCWFCHKVAWLVGRVRSRGVMLFGDGSFNWKGPGPR